MEHSKMVTKFVEWLDEEQGMGCTEDNIVLTLDTVDNFLNACRSYDAKSVEFFSMKPLEDMPVTIVRNSQRQKGEQRKDLFILDATSVRLVLAI